MIQVNGFLKCIVCGLTVDKITGKQLGGATGKGFMPGQSGNPAGRPKGSFSPMTILRKHYEEHPEDLLEFINRYRTNPINDKHQMEMFDGSPQKKVEISDLTQISTEHKYIEEIDEGN